MAPADALPSRIDERLINLALFLLDAEHPVTISEIFEKVEGYPSSGDPEARRQLFERDKRSLRSMGVDVQVEPLPTGQLGYRIRSEDWYLPDPSLSPEEATALAVAAAAVHIDDFSARLGLAKLGVPLPSVPTVVAELPPSPHLSTLDEAVRRRAQVTFVYHGQRRTVDPRGLLCRWGAWYLVGFDHLRGGTRTFRVDRIESDVRLGEDGSFDLDDSFDPTSELPREPWLIGDGEAFTVEIAVDADLAPLVCNQVGEERVVSRGDDGSVVVSLEVVNSAALRTWLMSMGDHAWVLGPEETVAEVVHWLEQMVR
jgi:proteasome accessory factor B